MKLTVLKPDIDRVRRGIQQGINDLGYDFQINVTLQSDAMYNGDIVCISDSRCDAGFCLIELNPERDREEVVRLFSHPYDYAFDVLEAIGEE